MNQFLQVKDILESLIVKEKNKEKKDILENCLDYLCETDFEFFDKDYILKKLVEYLKNESDKNCSEIISILENKIDD